MSNTIKAIQDLYPDELAHCYGCGKNNPDGYVDLRMATIIDKLKFPDLPRHDALNDSINVALMYLALLARGKRS